jgi:hypothetical protein
MNQQQPLNEGLRRGDLKNTIDRLFTIDQYASKMGNDKDVVVLRFRAISKEPAVDLMEFVEKGYEFVLDADMSSGEEKDGRYSIFVEIERNEKAPRYIRELLSGISQLAEINDWRFRWYRDIGGHDFSEEAIEKVVPLNGDDYEQRVEGAEASEVAEFFDQGALESIEVDNNKNITFKKPFAEPLEAKLIAIGEYETLKNVLRGGLQLDESSRGQVLYLNKYIGNYDINKIENHFLIRNGQRAVILAKEKW